MTWSLLQTGFLSGKKNMEIDSFLAGLVARNGEIPILRLYGWNPPAISIGYNQPEDDFDLDKLREEGISIVRRPTGGRAILHANEITYCIVKPIGTNSLKEIYHEVNRALLRAVRFLGIAAELVEGGNSTLQLYREPVSAACFSSSAKSEIQYLGRKLVGSAQRRLGNVVLQHGSLLLGPQHLHISTLLTNRSPEGKNYLYQHLVNHAIDAETVLERSVTFGEASVSIKQGFEQELGIRFVDPPESLLHEVSLTEETLAFQA